MVYRSRLRTSSSLNDSSSAAKETAAGLDTLGSLTSHHWSWDRGTNLLWVKAHGNKCLEANKALLSSSSGSSVSNGFPWKPWGNQRPQYQSRRIMRILPHSSCIHVEQAIQKSLSGYLLPDPQSWLYHDTKCKLISASMYVKKVFFNA